MTQLTHNLTMSSHHPLGSGSSLRLARISKRQSVSTRRVIALIFCFLFLADSAFAKCDSNTNVLTDCMDSLKDGVKNTFGSHDDAQKADSVNDAVQSCIKCAAENIQDSVNQISGDSGSGN